MMLYVSNLAPETKPAEILKAFEAHGKVKTVDVPTEQMKAGASVGAGRGFAFVDMPDTAQAQAALKALDKMQLGGRPVGVQPARPDRSFRHRR